MYIWLRSFKFYTMVTYESQQFDEFFLYNLKFILFLDI